jgi:hypothetical protein
MIAFITGLIGAIFGACIAYFSDWLKEQRKKRDEQHGAIVRTQLALIGQLNSINNIQIQFLDPHRKDPQRSMKLIRFDTEVAELRVAYDSISFLLVTINANLVLDVHAAEQSYFSAMTALTLRNQAFDKLHANSEVEKLDLQTGQCTVRPKDPRDLKLLTDTTDNLYKTADTARERLALQIKELEKAGKALYPKRKFLQIAGQK